MSIEKYLLMLWGNRPLMAAGIAWFIAQSIKTIIYVITNKQFKSERLWGAGGMPSSHTALVVALSIAMGRFEGIDSSAFAVSLIFAFVTIYDALGVRREAGNHAHILNKLLIRINVLSDDEIEPLSDSDLLKELIGHTPLQVIAGAALGIIVGGIIR